MSRLRRVLLFVLLLLAVVVLGGAAVLDPFHLRHARWWTAGLALLALMLVTAVLTTAAGRGPLRALPLLLGGTAVLTAAAILWLSSGLTGQGRDVFAVDGGSRELVVLETRGVAVDPVYSVVVRAGGGPVEQESLIYRGPERAAAPSEVRFIDIDTVEVRTDGGCLYRSEIEVFTLDVDPVHRPEVVGAC